MRLFIFITFFCILAAPEVYAKKKRTVKKRKVKEEPITYAVKENGKNIEVTTPYGTRTLFGSTGFDTNENYRLEVPMDAIRPQPNRELAALEEEILEESNSEEGEESDEEEEISEKRTKKKTKREIEEEEDTEEGTAALKPLPLPYNHLGDYVLEANHLYNAGKFYEASLVVEQINKEFPTYVHGWIMKGSLLYVQGQKDLAKRAWEQALAIEPENHQAKVAMERYR